MTKENVEDLLERLEEILEDAGSNDTVFVPISKESYKKFWDYVNKSYEEIKKQADRDREGN